MESRKYQNFYGNYKIGKGTKVGEFVDIAGKIGENCMIQSFVFIPEGVIIEDEVFIGPKVCFTNDKYPPSGGNWTKTLVKKGASIGAGSVILPGITIGENSLIGAGSVVTKSVPPKEVWYGNPARKAK